MIKFIKKHSIDQIRNEYAEMTFVLEDNLYNDAIIGVTENKIVIYNYFKIGNIVQTEHLAKVYNYKDDFAFTNEDYLQIEQSITEIVQECRKSFGEKSPIFCRDKYFIEKILPSLKEDEVSYFSKDYIENSNDSYDYDVTDLRNFEYYRNKQ